MTWIRRHWRTTLAVAAAVLVATTAGIFAAQYLRGNSSIDAMTLAESTLSTGDDSHRLPDGWARHGWGAIRGAGARSREDEQHVFRLGVLTMDLAAAVAGGDEPSSQAARLVAELRSVPFSEHVAAAYESVVEDPSAGPAARAARLSAAEQMLRDNVKSPHLELGLALESLRLRLLVAPEAPVPAPIRSALRAALSADVETAHRAALEQILHELVDGGANLQLAARVERLVRDLGGRRPA